MKSHKRNIIECSTINVEVSPLHWQIWILGAYGAAVLYRKKDDDSLVILKEINMHDLNAAERQLALNEVRARNSVSVLVYMNHTGL